MASILNINGKWRALVRRKGEKSYCKTFPTEGQAKQWAKKIEVQLDAGRKPGTPSPADKVLVSQLIKAYRQLRDTARPIEDTSNEHYMLKTLDAYLGHLDARTMTTEDLVEFAKTRRDEGAGPYTINMDISKLGTIFRMVTSLKGFTLPDVVGNARPALNHLKLIGGGNKRERRPTADELKRILARITERRGKPYADAALFAILTAMRRSEITRLLWDDLDENKKLVLIRNRKDPRQKEGNDQWIPLLNGAWELVQAQPRDSERIFPLHPQTISKYFSEAREYLDIPDLHFHDLRHHGVSLLFEQGYRIEQVAMVSGHRSWQHLKRYTNLKPEDLHAGPHPA